MSTLADSAKPGKQLPDFLRVPWRVRDAFIVFFLPWIVLPIAVVILLGVLSPVSPAAAAFLDRLQDGDPIASFGLTLIDAVGSLSAIAYYLRKRGAKWRDLGWRRFSLKKATILFAVVALSFFFLVAVAYALIQLVFPGFNANQEQTNEFIGVAPSLKPLSFFALVVLPPIIEETVFRGFLFPALATRYGYALGVISSSVLFGFAHLQANISIYTFILGLLLCILYRRLGSIFPGMAVHMMNNYLAFTALK